VEDLQGKGYTRLYLVEKVEENVSAQAAARLRRLLGA
jgi:hypothetical protein